MQQLHFWSLGNLNQGTDIWGGGQICFIFSHTSGKGKGKTWCPRVTSVITSLWKAHLIVIWSTLKDGISLPNTNMPHLPTMPNWRSSFQHTNFGGHIQSVARTLTTPKMTMRALWSYIFSLWALKNICCLIYSVYGIYIILNCRTKCASHKYHTKALYHGHLHYNTECLTFIGKMSWKHNGCFIHRKCLEQFHIHSKCSVNVNYYYQIFIIHQELCFMYFIYYPNIPTVYTLLVPLNI